MQAQIKVQNPGKMFVWLFFLFISSIQDMEKDSLSFTEDTV